jgi:hypothetical protein
MTTRKDFLAVGALAAAIPDIALGDAPAQNTPSGKLSFDVEGFTQLLDSSQSHKLLFAACELNGGEVLGAIRNTLNAYRDIGVTWNDVFPVAVLYHGLSICLAFDDSIWNGYIIPLQGKRPKESAQAKQIASVRKAGTPGNPCLREQGGENDTSIRSLVADVGTRFFVCNNAVHGVSNLLATALGKSADAVYGDLVHHLVPNAMLVPAGVWAVHAIQEQRFTLLQTSLATNA